MMHKDDVLFLCQFFYPEHNSSATLPFDTAKHLASKGYKVGALVGFPKEYNYTDNVQKEETVEGVKIKRIKYLQLSRVGKIGRLVNYFSFTFHSLIRIEHLKNYKVTIVYSNPPVLPIVPILAKKRFGTKIVFVSYDVYPEIAYASNSLASNGIISKAMRWINRNLYSNADCVIALTDEMKEYLLVNRKELSSDRVTTITNWAHEGCTESNEGMYKKFGYKEGQFIVAYFGNMGTCQEMDTLMNAARLLKDNEEIKFMIAGHGNKMETIRECIRENNLSNVQLIDFLTGEDYEEALAISSCYVVSLEKGLIGTCAPSKYYSYLQGGKPVITITEPDSFLYKEVQKENIGCSIQIDDAKGLKDSIDMLQKNDEYRKEAGERALLLYKEKYSKEIAMEKYSNLFKRLLR